ncbi:FHA domain-containing protein FhaB/FipA [Gryllotalpicola protaetiae]|uniref:FHA domain-containing protein n=1 Tax=Gryllotalpicola protaetiae TaxID=2419771 RepID=A0A387BR86_9MICO|nr:FHA domain-containing protein [Gryllotalpicola protaetiae]AYG03569.1 FHA domain-containing protein [Gryllotalpicola protaetiae]
MNPSSLTLLLLRIAFLIILWVFVFVIVYALRGDLFGTRAKKLPEAAAGGQASRAPSTPPSSAALAPPPAASPAAAFPAAPQPPPPLEDPEELGSGSEHPLAGLAIDRTGSVPVVPTASGKRTHATVFNASKLVITGGPRTGVEYELTAEPLTIGRSSESGLVIRDDYTSTHHARLMLWNNEWMLQDLDSTNGTYLDGERVTAPAQIPLDTPIKVGMTTFELRR